MFAYSSLKMIIKEHKRKPFKGPVCCLGRQAMPFTWEETVAMLEEEGVTPDPKAIANRSKLDVHSQAVNKKNTYKNSTSDVAFFALLGINQVEVVDISDYEKADYIFDLNKPEMPSKLEGRFDLVVDGGTFDHLFDLRQAFTNVVKMTAVGGRIFQWNAASNYCGQAYLSFGPDFFYDYYALNGFTDVQVFVSELSRSSQIEPWTHWQLDPALPLSGFKSSKVVNVSVWATKTAESTYDKIPTQGYYRTLGHGGKGSVYEENKKQFDPKNSDWQDSAETTERMGEANYFGPVTLIAKRTFRKVSPKLYHVVGGTYYNVLNSLGLHSPYRRTGFKYLGKF